MGRDTWSWIVPDGLWDIAEPLIPPSKVRPQGGGTQDTPDETLFAAIIYVLVSGCAWRALPPCFGISKSTAHRRFVIWSRAGVWGRLHEAVLDRIDECGLLDLSRVVLDSAHVRAKKGANSQARAPWTGVDQVPRCMSCPTGPGCPSWSVSPPATPTTATV
jgi:transposase